MASLDLQKALRSSARQHSTGSGVQGQSWLHSEFEVSVGSMSSCLKLTKPKSKTKLPFGSLVFGVIWDSWENSVPR